jgi:putative membrane protein
MVFEILLWFAAGIGLGTVMGLIPGLHPNTVVLLVPLLAGLQTDSANLLAFLVSLGIVNVFVDFIPSMLLGAPDGEAGLATLPGHRYLMAGNGYAAVRLAVIGGLGAVIVTCLLLPVLALAIPGVYNATRPHIHVLLIGFATLMVASEKTKWKMAWAAATFLVSGAIGLLAFQLPLDRTTLLFPILSGFFGLPHLILQLREKRSKMPEQKSDAEDRISAGPIGLGTAGGMLAGLLPGVGSAEIAGFLTIGKRDKHFLTTLGSLAAANILMSFLALWLIGNPRSGVAVAADQLVTVDIGLMAVIVAAAIAAVGIAAPLTLWLCKGFLGAMRRLDYRKVNTGVLAFLIAAIAIFTGPLGILLAATCMGLGLFVNLAGVRRGVLMGVLILPTILFFAGM